MIIIIITNNYIVNKIFYLFDLVEAWILEKLLALFNGLTPYLPLLFKYLILN
jgi:hypothetical protein